MNNSKTKQADYESNSLKDYLYLLRNNLPAVITITLVCLVAAIIYAVNSKNIYKAVTMLKISQPQGNILESPLMPDFQDFGSDRFVANEIEILKSYNLRERVAKSLIDSFAVSSSPDSFYLINEDNFNFGEKSKSVRSISSLAASLVNKVSIDQKRGLDIVEISAESPSAIEAALIANIYAKAYKNFNLEINRNQLTGVKDFLALQKEEKQSQLNKAEATLRNFQEKGGIIALDEQATSLIAQLSQFEAQKNAAQIELEASSKVLSQYNAILEKQSPRLADYLEGLKSEAYFKSLQEQLARLETNKDLAISSDNNNSNKTEAVKEYDKKIADIKAKLNEKIEVIKSSIFASSPEEVKELSQKIIEEGIKNQTLKVTYAELEKIVEQYDKKFNQLPKTSIELARFQRQRESLEKLYTLLEEKYQEALINEQSQPGNVLIIDNARRPNKPSKPNRMLIILIGFVMGFGLAFGYVFIKNYFDNTVKTPEDIQNRNINVLTWIPPIEWLNQTNGHKESEFIISDRPDSIPSESFRALRTRVQFSRLGDNAIKTILVSSSAPQEGKTLVSVNLAGSFAQTNKKTLILDCDLRKPRVHTVFNAKRFPGLIDYLFGHASLKDIINKTNLPSCDFISAGTIPPNPAEMLESKEMKSFLEEMKNIYDIIILDSPPIVAVTDAEILSRMVDAAILVVSSETTETELMQKSVDLLRNESNSFIGTVLNNFTYKFGYGSYYKYYYAYSHDKSSKEKKKIKTEKKL